MDASGSMGFFSKIQQRIDAIFSSMQISARDIISYVTFFGIGFLIGIGFKKYGKWIVAVILGAIVIMATLHYFEFISVHFEKIRCILGLSEVSTVDQAMTFVQSKIQTFWVEAVLFCIAVVVGFKLG